MKAWNKKHKRKHTTKIKWREDEICYGGIGLKYLDSKSFSITTKLDNGEEIIIKFRRYSIININKKSIE